MTFFQKSKKPIHAVLNQDKLRDLKRGYPWVFAHELKGSASKSERGMAILKDKSKSIIAKGMFDGSSSLAFRVCALEDILDERFILNRLQQALILRKRIFKKDTNGYRLLNGEGDWLPGLVCDVYRDTAVLKLDGLGPAAFWNVSAISDWLISEVHVNQVFLKEDSRTQDQGKWLHGVGTGKVEFLENGIRFTADVLKGQKTGFFFDQRDNRDRVRQLSQGASVLNLFGYTGGFSVYAGLGGAKIAKTIDSAKPAISLAEENWKLNNLPPSKHEALAIDAFDYLEQARSNKESWDIVIADPPSFASSKESVSKARTAYIKLFEDCARITASQGFLMASSCSSHIDFEAFTKICEEAVSKARRKAQVIGIHGQPHDHPYPLACPELRYLKFVILKLFT